METEFTLKWSFPTAGYNSPYNPFLDFIQVFEEQMHINDKFKHAINRMVDSGLITLQVQKKIDSTVDICDLEFSVRTFNCLKSHGINKMIDISNFTFLEMLEWPNFGSKSLKEVEIEMIKLGVSFKP